MFEKVSTSILYVCEMRRTKHEEKEIKFNDGVLKFSCLIIQKKKRDKIILHRQKLVLPYTSNI